MPVFSSNTTTPTVGVENFLANVNVAGKRFRLSIDLSVLQANDVLEIRVYKIILTGGTARVIVGHPITFFGVQSADNMIFISDVYDNYLTDSNSLRFSINQTFGTARDFPWTVEYELPDPANFGLTSIDSNGRLDIIKMAGQTLTVAAGVTVPSSLASPTNITAGTITTVTNLTNNNDKTGYALSSAGVQAIWDVLTSALTAVGSIGKLFVDNINASILAIKTKTDSLTFTKTGEVDSNVQSLNDATLNGDGSVTPWGP